MLHLVSYDLNKPEQNYPGLIARLRQLGAQKVLFSEWLLVSPSSAEGVRNDLQPLIDANDRIFVVELRNHAAWNNLMLDNNTVLALFKNATS